jgi:hypothetical protein
LFSHNKHLNKDKFILFLKREKLATNLKSFKINYLWNFDFKLNKSFYDFVIADLSKHPDFIKIENLSKSNDNTNKMIALQLIVGLNKQEM